MTLAQNNMYDANGNPVSALSFPSSNLPNSSYNNSSTGSIPFVVEDSIPIYTGIVGLAYDGEFLWAAGYNWYHIFKISPVTGNIIDSIPISFSQAYGLTYDGNDLWIVERTYWPYQHKVHKIDTSSGNILQSFSIPSYYPNGLAWDGNLWYNNNDGGSYTNQTHAISASTGGNLQTYSNYGQPAGLACDGQYLWCSHNGGIGIIQKYDISTFTIVDSIITPWLYPNDLAWDGSHLWLAENGHNMIFKIFAGNNGFGCTDSLACNYDSLATIDDSSCVYSVIWQQTFLICDGDSVVVGSSVYDTTGAYTDTLNASNGCDSIVYTYISIIPPIIWQQAFSICNGDSVVVGSSVYDSPGVYTDTLNASNGCDSIVYTNISIIPYIVWQQTFLICDGDSVVVGSSVYDTTGAYTDTLNAPNGCDSIVYTYISIIPPIIWQQAFSICNGDSVQVGWNTFHTAGTYTDTISGWGGGVCDSIIYTTIIVNQNTSSYDTLSVIASIVWNGDTLTVSGDYSVTLTNSVGCDSIVNLNLTISPSGILDIKNTERTLLRVTDILGRETAYKKRTPMFYIYNDGTVEKKIIIE